MPDIIGLDHIYITVTDLQRSEVFYDQVMTVFGFRKNQFILGNEQHIQYYNRDFGYVLRPARSEQSHDAYAAGLHHLCFRVQTQNDVLSAAQQLKLLNIHVSDPKLYPEYAPDYFAVFFSDPDGIRLEVTNYREERKNRHDHWEQLP